MAILNDRQNAGVIVRLHWRAGENNFAVTVRDIQSKRNYILYTDKPERAIEMFHHPFAYIREEVTA